MFHFPSRLPPARTHTHTPSFSPPPMVPRPTAAAVNPVAMLLHTLETVGELEKIPPTSAIAEPAWHASRQRNDRPEQVASSFLANFHETAARLDVLIGNATHLSASEQIRLRVMLREMCTAVWTESASAHARHSSQTTPPTPSPTPSTPSP